MQKYIPNFDEVRAALGVGEDELTDERLNLPMYLVLLEEQLETLYQNLPTILEDIALKIEDETVTRAERRVYGLAQVYSSYYVAQVVAPSMPMFAVKSTTDGKAAEERFNDAYAQTLEDVNARAAEIASRLLDALEAIGEARPVVVYTMPFATATIGVDPVTGA